MANRTLTYTGTLVIETCWCGIKHAIPEDLKRWAKADPKNAVYCPLGHSWVFRKSAADEARERAEAAEARMRHAEDQLQAASADAEALRVRLLRDRQRYANGVCPCCNRSFPALARHMATQHPDYDRTHIESPAAMVEFQCSCGRTFGTLRGLRIHQSKQRREGWNLPDASRWRAHLTVA